jgi:hypothetical protein
MRHSLHPPARNPVWRRSMFVLAAAGLLAGCANGDFDRVRPLLVRDDIHDWVGREAVEVQGIPPSQFQVTDDERQLRDLAYPLIQPSYGRHRPWSVFGEYGVAQSKYFTEFDRSAYATHLMGDRYRSPAARYARLSDDINNDATRLPAFFETAGRVLDIDSKRRRSMAYIGDLGPDERANALSRMDENASIIEVVRTRLGERVSGYRFALERLVIMTPMPQAADVERRLNHLDAMVAYYRTHTAPTVVQEQSLASAR